MGKGELGKIISSKVHETLKFFKIVTISISESYILIRLCDLRNYFLPKIFLQSLLKWLCSPLLEVFTFSQSLARYKYPKESDIKSLSVMISYSCPEAGIWLVCLRNSERREWIEHRGGGGGACSKT